jgi:antitoxin ParD1/3/4
LGQHFESFIREQLEAGRYSSISAVIRAGLRLLEESEARLTALRAMLKEGEESGIAGYSYESLMAELDNDADSGLYRR